MDDDELDHLIDGPDINNDNIQNNSSTTTPVITTTNSILNREYGEELSPPSLPSVSEQLANAFSKWACVTPSRDLVKDLFKEINGPDNVKGLEPVHINDVIYCSKLK